MSPDTTTMTTSLPSLREASAWNGSCSFHGIGQRRESAHFAPRVQVERTTMVQHGQSHDRLIPAPATDDPPRGRLLDGQARRGRPGGRDPRGPLRADSAATDDDVVILTAAGAQVSARPGSAMARSAAAEAVASRGAARVQAAAALAEADSDEGAIAQGAAAVAVADPDQGAIAQSASAVASASSQDDVVETPQAAPQAAPRVRCSSRSRRRRRPWRRSGRTCRSVDAASGAAVAAVIAFAVVAGPRARASAVREFAVASGPRRCHRLASATWIRVRCPRSSRSHRRSRLSARSSCGIAARPLRLPRSS